MVTRRKFIREFKLEAVKLVTERGVAVAQAGKDLDVHENVLRKWVRELREQPQEAFPGNGKQKARADVFDYIKRFYNPTRRHSTLGYVSPIQFEEAQKA